MFRSNFENLIFRPQKITLRNVDLYPSDNFVRLEFKHNEGIGKKLASKINFIKQRPNTHQLGIYMSIYYTHF